jgi:hypothetical protein
MDNRNDIVVDVDEKLEQLFDKPGAITDFSQQLMTQQLKEFKSSLIAFKAKDEEIERCFEAGKEPPEELTEKFEEMKENSMKDIQYFKKNDFNLFESKSDRTVMSYVKSIIHDVYEGVPNFYVLMD